MNVDAIKSAYRQALGEFDQIHIRRYFGDGEARPFFDYPCTARETEFDPKELVGPLKEGDRKLIVFADDLLAAQFPVPVKANDAAIIRGKEINIVGVNDKTRRVQGVLIAYELGIRG